MRRSPEQKRLDRIRRAAVDDEFLFIDGVQVDPISARNILKVLSDVRRREKLELLNLPIRQLVVGSNRVAFED
jgi:hypothetical protein